MALDWVYEVRTDKVVICSDSMAVLMSLQSLQTNRSDILSEIMITLYSIKHRNNNSFYVGTRTCRNSGD